jgi:TonB family protein
MEYNVNQWYQDQILKNSEEASSWGYHFTSSVLHVLAFSSAIFFGSLVPRPELPPLTEITIIEKSAEAPVVAAQVKLPKSAPSGAEGIQPSESLNKIVDKDAVVVSRQKKVAKRISHTKTRTVKSRLTAKHPSKVARRVIHGPTVKVSEIEAPILETDEFEQTLKSDVKFQAKKFDETSISEELEKIDRENSYKVAALQKDLDKQTDDFMSEQEEDIKSLSREVALTDAQLKEQVEKSKKQDQARIVQAKAAETLAAKQAAEQSSMQAAQAAKEAQALARGRSLGVDGPVRSLQEIKQMPGNRKPMYDAEDRLARRQGEVSFLAYVSRDGQITKFKLLQGTGHRSLDAKTLGAIRTWRFYSGQEGWVEIPYKWDLKGEPQEMPATLRRKISQK